MLEICSIHFLSIVWNLHTRQKTRQLSPVDFTIANSCSRSYLATVLKNEHGSYRQTGLVLFSSPTFSSFAVFSCIFTTHFVLLFSSPARMWYFPFSALTLLVWWQEGHLACKKLDVGLLLVMIWLELCTTYSSSYHHHFHHSLLQ